MGIKFKVVLYLVGVIIGFLLFTSLYTQVQGGSIRSRSGAKTTISYKKSGFGTKNNLIRSRSGHN